jgi:hypothetical protein
MSVEHDRPVALAGDMGENVGGGRHESAVLFPTKLACRRRDGQRTGPYLLGETGRLLGDCDCVLQGPRADAGKGRRDHARLRSFKWQLCHLIRPTVPAVGVSRGEVLLAASSMYR